MIRSRRLPSSPSYLALAANTSSLSTRIPFDASLSRIRVQGVSDSLLLEGIVFMAFTLQDVLTAEKDKNVCDLQQAEPFGLDCSRPTTNGWLMTVAELDEEGHLHRSSKTEQSSVLFRSAGAVLKNIFWVINPMCQTVNIYDREFT